MNKKLIIGIASGVVLLTAIAGVMSQSHSDTDKIMDIEKKRERKLDLIDNASVTWQQGAIDDLQFTEIINLSITDTDTLRGEYLSLRLLSTYDNYKKLSIDSLDKEREALQKMKEYVQTEDPALRESLRVEFDQLLITSFENRGEALRELD